MGNMASSSTPEEKAFKKQVTRSGVNYKLGGLGLVVSRLSQICNSEQESESEATMQSLPYAHVRAHAHIHLHQWKTGTRHNSKSGRVGCV